MLTFLDYYTGDSLGYYIVLALRSELLDYLTICPRMRYVIRFAINEDLHIYFEIYVVLLCCETAV